ncbi:MAG: hypothetical protein KF861_10340, partial [Planctomycetaceae bacterium]|nr:hypothetical protein [Planctomycetaceae bacterium]
MAAIDSCWTADQADCHRFLQFRFGSSGTDWKCSRQAAGDPIFRLYPQNPRHPQSIRHLESLRTTEPLTNRRTTTSVLTDNLLKFSALRSRVTQIASQPFGKPDVIKHLAADPFVRAERVAFKSGNGTRRSSRSRIVSFLSRRNGTSMSDRARDK